MFSADASTTVRQSFSNELFRSNMSTFTLYSG